METGGSNIQFAINPETGEMVVIEMNPRVSRSSALASKATGFPIAKIAAKLAVGYTLDEIANDITRETLASFEPTIDYCVVKVPRWTFEKFPGAEDSLTTSMKSVGETMAIGRTFKEALQKAVRSLEIGKFGLGAGTPSGRGPCPDLLDIENALINPHSNRLFCIYEAFDQDMTLERIYELSRIDPWFLYHIQQIHGLEKRIMQMALEGIKPDQWEADFFKMVKEYGFSDMQLANVFDTAEQAIREMRTAKGIEPVYKLVDTCAGEFEAYTPYSVSYTHLRAHET